MNLPLEQVVAALKIVAADPADPNHRAARRMIGAYAQARTAHAAVAASPGIDATEAARMSQAMGTGPGLTRQVYKEGNSLVLGGLRPRIVK